MNTAKKIENSLSSFENEILPTEPPSSLPLLDEYRKNYKRKDYFENVDVLFIQHHLGPFIPKIEAMINDGLDPNRTWFVDIPYSTNTKTKSILNSREFPIHQMTKLYDNPLEDYNLSQSDRVKYLMFRMVNRPNPKPLLVMDDGAYFLRFLLNTSLYDPEIAEVFRGTCIVEQTTRGHRFINDKAKSLIENFNLQVVSIARCKTKLHFESPFIGAAVSRALTNKIGDEVLGKLKKIAVIGFGAVGKATVFQLLNKAPKAKIDVMDINQKKIKKASQMNAKCKGIKSLKPNTKYELIVGCTGYSSFEVGDRKFLADGAFLASGSSAAVEFNRAGFVELADKYPDDEIEILDKKETIKQGIHADIKFRQEGGKVFSFLNAGFPINFDGKIECLPYRMIQATHALLYSAAVQALKNKMPGVVQKIQSEKDNWIYEKAIKFL